jgi:RNA polymerase sigma-70 factor (ECF subfamily)
MTPGRIDQIATRWSLVRRAHTAGEPTSAAEARQQLVLHYAPAVRKYIGGILHHTEDADELAQDVVVRLLRGDFAGADPNRGRFRDLLKTAVRNMVRHHWEKQNLRRPADLELDHVADDDTNEVDDEWHKTWQNTVVDHVWAVLKDDEDKGQGPPAYTVLRLRTLHPDDSSDQLAGRLAAVLGTPVRADACRQILRRARVKFAEALVKEIRMGLAEPSDDEVREELAALGLLEYVADILPLGKT